jgi:hypothetical protein
MECNKTPVLRGRCLEHASDHLDLVRDENEKLEKQLEELREKLRWIPVDYKNITIPINVPLLCRLRWCGSGNITHAILIYTESDDHSWETADDGSEISFSVDVTHYMLIPELEDGE